ncbi:MAG: hypothetical protein Q7S40_24435 [Opitutaceae bacterium]|nr:hypothetical protein [Opitutaceae bacterium]
MLALTTCCVNTAAGGTLAWLASTVPNAAVVEVIPRYASVARSFSSDCGFLLLRAGRPRSQGNES